MTFEKLSGLYHSIVDKPRIAIIENEVSQQHFMGSLLSAGKKYDLVFFSSGNEFLNSFESGDFNLAYVDLRLSDMGGIEVIEKTIFHHPRIQMVIQSSLPDEESFFRALRAGAIGYHWKADLDSFESKNDIFLNGGSILSPTMAFRINRFFKVNNVSVAEGAEVEILKMLVKGYTVDMICERKNISYKTIYSSMRNILNLLKSCSE